MKYEIGNPSEKCFLESDDPLVAAACILFLGNGKYFCIETSSGNQIPGTFFALGGDVEETWKEYNSVGFEAFITSSENQAKMAECYESFSYASEMSSMNIIGKRVKQLAEEIRKKISKQSRDGQDE